MTSKKYDFQVGDIVTCSRRRGPYLFKVTEIILGNWTADQARWGHCDVSDIGKQYVKDVKLQSIFQMTVKPRVKMRKVGLTCDTYWCTKVEPQEVMDFIQNLNKFLVDTWP